MKTKQFILLLLLFIAAIQFVGCSGSNNTTSGTGVGNPGKTTVSFITRSSIDENAIDSFTISSEEGLTFTIKEAYINAREIHFMHNGGSTNFEGPYKFNAFNGESDPKIDFDNLPDYLYTGLDFIAEVDKDVNDIYSIELYGTFIYKSISRNFSMKLNIKGNAKDKYSLEGGPAKLNFNTNNIFQIDLEVDGWLQNIKLKDYLDNNTLSLESNGDLVIDENSDWKASKEIAKDVKKNIFKSGKLFLIQQ